MRAQYNLVVGILVISSFQIRLGRFGSTASQIVILLSGFAGLTLHLHVGFSDSAANRSDYVFLPLSLYDGRASAGQAS